MVCVIFFFSSLSVKDASHSKFPDDRKEKYFFLYHLDTFLDDRLRYERPNPRLVFRINFRKFLFLLICLNLSYRCCISIYEEFGVFDAAIWRRFCKSFTLQDNSEKVFQRIIRQLSFLGYIYVYKRSHECCSPPSVVERE